MATQNLTRETIRSQKKGRCIAHAILDYTDEIGTSADSYELFVLPPASMILSAAIFVVTASDAATSAEADVGFAGGDTLIDGADLTSAANSYLSGGTNAVVPQIAETGGTVTFLPTYTGATTVGKFHIVIEYLEYEKNTGEYTNFSKSA